MNSSDLERRFSWQTLARTASIVTVVLGLLEGYWYWSSGHWDSTNFVVLAVFAWIFAAYAWRWRKFRRQLKDGTFPEAQYRANPTVFLMGTRKEQRLVILIGVTITIIWAAYRTFTKT